MKNLYCNVVLLTFILSSCGNEDGNNSGGINIDYVGQWTLTFVATYQGSECSGDMMGSGDGSTNGSTFVTLYEDGTYLNTDNLACTEPGNANDNNCQGTWSSDESAITLTSFFSMDYSLGQENGATTMTSELEGSTTSNGETYATCTKSVFTQQ